jgi:4-hydroxyacetophenone monooxygenase
MTMDQALRAHIAEGVAMANVPTLVLVLVQLTGDERWLQAPYLLTKAPGLDDHDSGGLPPERQAEVRAAALDAILAWREGRKPAVAEPSPEFFVRLLSGAMGEAVPPEYGPMLQDTFGTDAVRDRFQKITAIPEDFSVLIIGASFSGLCAAAYLQQAGIPYVIIEKNADVGGTWLENRYPGCGVDAASHYYSYSFFNYDWSMYFALREELQQYIAHTADRFDIRKYIQFGTAVERLFYDESRQRWNVELRRADGTLEIRHAPVVISAVGIFNPPVFPKIPGLGSFKNPSFHTAHWPEGFDVRGKRVAIIGNGASAMQIGPEIQPLVKSLTVFQRSPHWIIPFPLFRKQVPPPIRTLMREVPLYQQWYRARIAWKVSDSFYPLLQKDPSWPHKDRSLNQASEDMRQFLIKYIKDELGGRDDLLPKLVPTYPPWGKRMLRDNGWYRMLTKPNVALVDTPIARIVEDRLILSDGTEIEADVLVIATGFDAVHFMTCYDAIGRDGVSLRQTWGDDARAYKGLAVPGFPNFFTLYGPNTQPGHGGSLIYVVEMQMHYIMDLLDKMLAKGIGTAEIRQDVHDAYNEKVDRQHENMIWTHGGTRTYYRNDKGRVVVNYPFRNVDLFTMTRAADLSEYITVPRR